MLKGRIVKNISNLYQVKTTNGLYNCKPRGKFRCDKRTPLVGDEVEIDEENNYLLKIEARKNELKRPSISNIDIALIVTSLKRPELSLNLLDKELCSIIIENIEPVICFTKLDLLNKEELSNFNKIRKYYESIGIKVFDNLSLDKLVKYLKGKYVVLTGQTGAGKSSLINKIDESKHIKVGEISDALGRGRHTTRHTEFHEVKGIMIADTPGFSSLDLSKYSDEDIKNAFVEIRDVTCLYRDCKHIKEEDCQVKRKVEAGEILQSRYDNYKSLISR